MDAWGRMDELDRELRRLDEDGLWSPTPRSRDWTPGRWLWARRRLIEMSQADLSRRSGLAQASISEIENDGDAKWSSLEALARALGCELVIRLRPGPEADSLPRSRGRGKRPPRRRITGV